MSSILERTHTSRHQADESSTQQLSPTRLIRIPMHIALKGFSLALFSTVDPEGILNGGPEIFLDDDDDDVVVVVVVVVESYLESFLV